MAEQNITPLDRIGYQFIINKDQILKGKKGIDQIHPILKIIHLHIFDNDVYPDFETQRTGKKGLDYQMMGKKGLDHQKMGKKGQDYQRIGKKGLDYLSPSFY